MASRRNGRALAVASTAAPVRCAAYCRVSTEAQADKEFNSIEAQHESCASYIGLHREEGWTAVTDRYHDGGFSAANTNRPALKRLLADVETGKIDVVVVYKFNRLSRSMLDFLQLLDFFKRHGVSFVSVSQRFDTSTPVGEMTLNILLSFAQFERQIIAERTRDKVRAARRRGRWTGGMPPLGYDVASEGGRLVINPDEAEQVRSIFELFIETPSLTKTAAELNRRAWRQKSWTTRDGKRRQGRSWDRVALRRVLTDVRYTGRQILAGEAFAGEHEGIVHRRVFDQVQRLLAENHSTGGARMRNEHGALLRGLLRCAACDRSMAHQWSRGRHGKRVYRYYRCQAALKGGAAACPSKPVPAQKIEDFVVDQIRRIGADPALQEQTFRQAVAQLKAQRRGLKVEAKRLQGELVAVRADVERWVATLARTTGPAATAIQAELEKAQERLATLEARQREVTAELKAIAAQNVDEADLGRALEQLNELWSVLLAPERERVLGLLIERVDYSGEGGDLRIHWRLAGLGSFAAEVNGGTS